ncbi:hypothetical protein ANO11243_023480 [Dothideomycetidae sp. 11243]|nr:hypothetical protein ANO11243_023480 [fungal sp. No.11243]
MGCCAARAKGHIDEHAKWDYINLDDFHSTSSWTPINYLWVWIYAGIGVAVFALDCFTAVNLLILDKWSSQIKPAIDLKYSKWIFVGCIMFSFALYLYEWARALRVMRRGGIAESYMDPLAVQVQCMRKKGFRRFLVFASLTKSKKGTDYIAFFVYFQFNSAVRIIFAEGGRQFVNAATLRSVAQVDLIPVGANAAKHGGSPVAQFFLNILALWNHSKQEALILGSMTVTLVIWVFSAICLLSAVVFYILFLWHYVPQSDGRLSIYCRRKIDRRLEKIVEKKVTAAIEDAERKRYKAEARMVKKHGKGGSVSSLPSIREPTLPKFGDYDEEKSTSLDITRSDSMATLPPYTSRAPTSQEPFGLQRQPTLPDVDSISPHRARPPMRQNNYSYGSNAPLLDNSGEMGYDSRPQSPMGGPPRLDRQGSNGSLGSFHAPPRVMTSSPLGPQRGMQPPQRMPPRSNAAFGPGPDRNPMSRMGSAMNDSNPYGPPSRTNTPGAWSGPDRPSRVGTPASMQSQRPTQQRQVSRQSFNRPFMHEDRPSFNSSTPPPLPEASPLSSLVASLTPSAIDNKPAAGKGGYIAFNPYTTRSPSVPAQIHASAPRRNMTAPYEMQPLGGGMGQNGYAAPRSHTAPPERNNVSSGDEHGDDYYGNVF